MNKQQTYKQIYNSVSAELFAGELGRQPEKREKLIEIITCFSDEKSYYICGRLLAYPKFYKLTQNEEEKLRAHLKSGVCSAEDDQNFYAVYEYGQILRSPEARSAEKNAAFDIVIDEYKKGENICAAASALSEQSGCIEKTPQQRLQLLEALVDKIDRYGGDAESLFKATKFSPQEMSDGLSNYFTSSLFQRKNEEEKMKAIANITTVLSEVVNDWNYHGHNGRIETLIDGPTLKIFNNPNRRGGSRSLSILVIPEKNVQLSAIRDENGWPDGTVFKKHTKHFSKLVESKRNPVDPSKMHEASFRSDFNKWSDKLAKMLPLKIFKKKPGL